MAHDAFLRAILDNPNDDTPRLVYADWLEERGDPRGEFIHLQYALEGMADDDDRRWALQIRERQLLCQHGKGWAGRPLRRLVRRYSFRRGFVENVSLSARDFLQRGEELFRLAPIRAVRLSDCLHWDAELTKSSLLGRLTGLDLRHNEWFYPTRTEFPVRSPQIAGLRSLCLRGTGLCSDAGIRAVASCPHFVRLHSLDVSGDLSVCDVASMRALTESPYLTNLRSLTLGGDNVYLPRQAFDCLLHSPLLKRLNELDLSVNGNRLLQNEGLPRWPALLSSSPGAAGLRRLRLRGIRNEPPDQPLIAEGSCLRNLTTLELEGTAFTLTSALELAEVALPSLKVLRLDGLFMGSQARLEQFLANASRLPRLTVLDLRSIPVDSDALRALAEGSLLPRLRSLCLADCGFVIGGGGGVVIAGGVRKLVSTEATSQLVHLDLSNNDLDDTDAESLAASPPLGQLLSLDLRHNRIGGPGAASLARSPHLGQLALLDLGNNPVPPSVRPQLRQRFGWGVRYSSG